MKKIIVMIMVIMFLNIEVFAAGVMRVSGSVTHRSISKNGASILKIKKQVNSSIFIMNNKKRGGEQDEEKDKAE